MPIICLETLHCSATEDRRWDDCLLDVTPDDEPTQSRRRNMRRGETWELGQEVTFTESVSLRLWDLDRRRNDHLGTVEVDSTLGPGRAVFDLDDAHYEMTYDVVESGRTAVEVAVAGLESSTSAGVWRHISRDVFQSQIMARVEQPELIDQAQAPLCGPTVITYELARTDPVRYVQLARELFETGYLPLIGNTINVPDGLKDDQVGGGMPAVDWMFAATLRNDANAVLRVRSDLLGGVRGYSLAGSMMDWSREVLGMTDIDDVSTETGGEMNAIRRAGEIVDGGGHAFLQVEALPLLRGGRDRHHYDHWLPLLAGPFVDGDDISFATYSWGRQECVEVSVDTFCESFHGVVTARRP